ncbi:putative NADH dehydrogenase [Apostichopus japonicus]|uniref:NADH dehydrogenase [ubiquinone] 1 alpha subcomplex assembly factor 3 n=1 Tax=Stichopus japonicus TaxID=307972 RepID=A0A2G8JFN6_STIJA|nr:putative NADH dehydrogenase [Apostichopus japonicus]
MYMVSLVIGTSAYSPSEECLHSSSQFRGQLYPTDDELYSKTSVSLLSKESTEVPYISKYSARGFTISGDVIVGPVAILPWSLVHWNIAGVGDISKESLSLFHLLEPRVEILVIGTGSQWHRLNPELHKFMRSKGIAMEVQVTPHACSTFNFLVGEGRVVAAGLIPPER